MPSIDFEVYCECGNLLNGKEIRGDIEVESCEKCLEEAREKGYAECEKDNDL